MELKIKGKRISPLDIIILTNNNDNIQYGTRRKNSFFVTDDTFGEIPYSKEDYENIIMSMSQIETIQVNSGEPDFFTVVFADKSIARYEIGLEKTMRDIYQEQQNLKEKARIERERASKSVWGRIKHSLAIKLASVFTIGGTLFLPLAACDYTAPVKDPEEKTQPAGKDEPITIELATSDPSKATPVITQKPVETPAPTNTPVIETDEQIACRKNGMKLYEDIYNAPIASFDVFGLKSNDEIAKKSAQQIAIDFVSLYLAGINSSNLNGLNPEEAEKYRNDILDNFIDIILSESINPMNDESIRIYFKNYLDGLNISENLKEMFRNSTALVVNYINSISNNPYRMEYTANSESEKTKFARGYRSEDEILLNYINETVGKDNNFKDLEPTQRLLILRLFEKATMLMPKYVRIQDELGYYYHTSFVRHDPYAVWLPKNENGEAIFYQVFGECEEARVGTYEEMLKLKESYNASGNFTGDKAIEAEGITTTITLAIEAAKGEILGKGCTGKTTSRP